MRDRTWIRRIVVGAGIAFVVAIAGAFVAVRPLSGDAPAEARLTLDPSTSGSTAPGASTVGSAGDWMLDTTRGSLADGTATYAGYRIQEELGGIGANTAVGRTQQVSGSMSISGGAITDLVVTVDMTTLTSDEDRRDMSLRDRGLETSTFPQASFTLTEPIVLDHRPAVGQTIKVSATGDLLLHGITRSVTVPVEARRTGSEMRWSRPSTSRWPTMTSRHRWASPCCRSLTPARWRCICCSRGHDGLLEMTVLISAPGSEAGRPRRHGAYRAADLRRCFVVLTGHLSNPPGPASEPCRRRRE